MTNYIEKNVLAAEINRLIKSPMLYKSENVETRISVLEHLLSFLDTLEVKEMDLEEAADNYVGHAPEIDEDLSCFIRRNAFIAGAKWKKKRLMENAVEAVIHPYDGEIWVDKDLLSVYNDCQRVKLIIIEEE